MARRRGVAQFFSRGEEALKRGIFVVRALKRIASAEDKKKQFDTEKRYFASHQQARERRQAAARMIDEAVNVYGNTLGWYSVQDDRTTADCKSAHGKNFLAGRPPLMGYPSTVHPNCRCSPGAPWPEGQTLR